MEGEVWEEGEVGERGFRKGDCEAESYRYRIGSENVHDRERSVRFRKFGGTG
jgi:hypothetical protein